MRNSFSAYRIFLSKIKHRSKVILWKIYSLVNIRSRGLILEGAVVCSRSEVKYQRPSTIHILHYDNGKQKGYLRICRLHKEPRKYLDGIISDWFEQTGLTERSGDFRNILTEKLSTNKNLRKFFHMWMPFGRKYPDDVSPLSEYLASNDASIIGVDGKLPEWFSGMLEKFAVFASFPVYESV